MKLQNKMLHCFHTSKTRNVMVLTIFVMVALITVIFYTPLSLETQVKVPEIVRNKVLEESHQFMVPETPQMEVTGTSQIKIPEKKFEKCPLYIFGDSLYDTGMGIYIRLGPVAGLYPYGKTYFKRPAGRFSDGRLIPDFIAQFAKLPFPEPYGNPRLKDYSKSVNFADAAAGVLVDGRKNTLNLKLQTEFFVEMVGKMEKHYGKAKTKKLVSKAVLLFNIGSNDYVDIWLQNPKPLRSSFVNSFIDKILGNFTTSITRMYNHGARKFAFQNYGPVGCMPLFLKPDGGCSDGLNDLARLHNLRFHVLAHTWARQLPDFNYIIYDFYTSLTARLFNGAQYGFKETRAACCGIGPFNAKFTCSERKNYTLCKDISSHLFFDPAHPTEKAYMQFAQEFWNGPPHLVTPSNLKTLFNL